MLVQIAIDDKRATIALTGRLDHNLGCVFREGYEPLLNNPEIEKIEIDLSAADYMDSSALGHLLLFRERVANTQIEISLVNSQGIVRTLLEAVNFGEVFALR